MKTLFKISSALILVLIMGSFNTYAQTSSKTRKPKTVHGPNFIRSSADSVFAKGRKCFGVAAVDVNNDGYLDLFFNNMPDQNDLYMNDGKGGFMRITEGEIVKDSGPATGQAWADYDNDGDLDLFVVYQSKAGNVLYRNNGDGTFEKPINTGLTDDHEFSFHPTWADINGDGYLDLLVCNNSFFADQSQVKMSIYLQDGQGDFVKDTLSSLSQLMVNSSSANFCDYDEDGDADLLISTWGGGVHLYNNDGRGNFTKSAAEFAEATGNFTSCSWVDFDSDGDFDIFLTRGHPDKESCLLFRNMGDEKFEYVANSPIYEVKGRFWNSGWGDFDNDGDLDLSITDLTEHNYLFENDGVRGFVKINDHIIVQDSLSKNACANLWVDYDNDGDLDLILANIKNGHSPIFENLGNTNHWLKFKCVGNAQNRSAVGAVVKVKSTINGRDVWQVRQVASVEAFRTVNLILHFGLGDASKADEVKIIWPSGKTETLKNVKANQLVELVENKTL